MSSRGAARRLALARVRGSAADRPRLDTRVASFYCGFTAHLHARPLCSHRSRDPDEQLANAWRSGGIDLEDSEAVFAVPHLRCKIDPYGNRTDRRQPTRLIPLPSCAYSRTEALLAFLHATKADADPCENIACQGIE